MKNLLILLITVISINQTLAQLWVKSGHDYVADTSYYNSLQDVCIDSMATKVVISINNLNIQTGQEEYITQAYTRNNGNLTELGLPILGNPNEDSDVTSSSLSIDGETLIIGRRSYDFRGMNLSGVIEVYELNGNNNWIQKGDSIGGYGVAANFGRSVDISNDGNTIIAGGDEGTFGGTGGYIRVFDWNGTNWVQKGDSIRKSIAYTKFGSSVKINNSGNIIAVGAKEENDTINSIFDAGSITIYEWNGTNWEQKGQKFYGLNAQEDLGRENGFSLSNNGLSISIGYSKANSDSGYVKVFDWDSNSSNWNQRGNTIKSQYQSTDFGIGTNLSGDGQILSITKNENLIAKLTYKYDNTSNTWVKFGNSINGYTNLNTYYLADIYNILNYDGPILTNPGRVNVPNYLYAFTSYVRFYEFDENAVDINTHLPREEVSIYPNPTNGAVQIQLNSKENHRIGITDITGKSIFNFETNKLNNTLDFSLYPKGMYIVTIIRDSKLITTNKILLQ